MATHNRASQSYASAVPLLKVVRFLTFSRSVPEACSLAASCADSLCGCIMWNSDTRLTASGRLEANTDAQDVGCMILQIGKVVTSQSGLKWR